MSSNNPSGFGQSYPVLPDTRVDNLAANEPGVIDELPSLDVDLDIPDRELIRNLELRIKDNQDYWNAPQGFNLYNVRQENQKLYLGDHLNLQSLYRYQVPYIENQVYVASQAIKAYLTASMAQPEVAPSEDSPKAKQFAQDAEKILMAHGLKKKVRLATKQEHLVQHAMLKRGAVMYFYYDEVSKEIIPIVLNPDECVQDKNAKQGENQAIFSRDLKMSANEACRRWPKKRKAIFKAIGVAYQPQKQETQEAKDQKMDMILDVREVWVTQYNRKYEPEEMLVYYLKEIVLERKKNPHWLYASPEKNFFDEPFKPIISLNFDNDGEHVIDNTSAIEQAGKLQYILNRRGRQLMELADKANGVLIVDTFKTSIQMTDAQDLTRDPNQVIVINTKDAGGANGQEGIFELPAAEIPPNLYQDKVDLRTQIYTMMGAPTDFSGAEDVDGDDDTLGQSQMKKDQAQGRQDLYVRAIERFWDEYFNMLYQLMIVWYDEKHYSRYNGGDGEYDYLVASRDILDNNVGISVRAGSVLPFDKKRQEVIAMALLKEEAISLLDAYKMLHVQNPQQMYDNWAKQKTDPMALARDALDDVDETKAYVAFVEIMNGKKPDEPDDCTKEFILTLRKIMVRSDFLKAKKSQQKAFLDFYEKALSGLELRTQLDMMGKEGLQELEPDVPLQPLPPPVMPQMAGMPPMGMPPGQPGAPPMTPPQAGMVPPNGQPPQAPGMPGIHGNPMAPQQLPQPGMPQPMQSAIPQQMPPLT